MVRTKLGVTSYMDTVDLKNASRESASSTDTQPTHNAPVENTTNQPLQENPVWEVVRFFIIAILIVAPIRIYIAQPFIVSGQSMDPTFSSGEYLIVDEISYRFEDPERGDVIVLKYPRDPRKFFIKRIIGLPGETVKVERGAVSVTTEANPIPQPLSEPYVVFDKNEEFELTLTEEEYFVMGDNRAASLDSRAWGALPRDLIVGRALLRLFPITHAAVNPGDHPFSSGELE
jgi:signal peptidase I